jgi:hypothetical protein
LQQELLKYSDEDDTDYPNMEKAVEKLHELANHINESKRKTENMQKILHLADVLNKKVSFPKSLPHLLISLHLLSLAEGSDQTSSIAGERCCSWTRNL